jgi:hypothetical protein
MTRVRQEAVVQLVEFAEVIRLSDIEQTFVADLYVV